VPRVRKSTAETKAKLAAPPKATRDWAPIVDALTEDPQKRAALMLEMAQIDELVAACREKALNGVVGSVRMVHDLEKQRARLLRLTSAELGDGGSGPEGEVDRLVWTNRDGGGGDDDDDDDDDDGASDG
jgi:hypothetical protein